MSQNESFSSVLRRKMSTKQTWSVKTYKANPPSTLLCLYFNTNTAPPTPNETFSFTSDLPENSRASLPSMHLTPLWTDTGVSPSGTQQHDFIHPHTQKNPQTNHACIVTLSPRWLHLTTVTMAPVHISQERYAPRIRDTDMTTVELIHHQCRLL